MQRFQQQDGTTAREAVEPARLLTAWLAAILLLAPLLLGTPGVVRSWSNSGQEERSSPVEEELSHATRSQERLSAETPVWCLKRVIIAQPRIQIRAAQVAELKTARSLLNGCGATLRC